MVFIGGLERGLRFCGDASGRRESRALVDRSDVGIKFGEPVRVLVVGGFEKFCRALSSDERIVWFAWVAALTMLARLSAMRRRPSGD